MQFMRLIRRRRRLLPAIVILALAILGLRWFFRPRPVFGDGNARIAIDKALICAKVPGMVAGSGTFSEDGKHYAYAVERNGRQFVVAEGVAGPECDKVDQLAFGAGNRHFVYVAEAGGKKRVVTDGIPGPEYDEAGRWVLSVDHTEAQRNCYKDFVPPDSEVYSDIQFSPDGRRVAYIAKKGEKEVVVVDGKEGKEYDFVGYLEGWSRDGFGTEGSRRVVFSADSAHFLYFARRGTKSIIVIDGVEGAEYDEVHASEWNFKETPDLCPYLARSGKKWVVVAGGKEGKQYDEVWTIETLEGKHLVYCAYEGGKCILVRDGVEGQRYDGIRVYDWDDNAQPLLYALKKDGKWRFVSGGVEGTPYDHIGWPAQDSRRKHVAYVAEDGGKEFVVLDGVADNTYDGIQDLRFSPGGNRLAYTAKVADKEFVVVDDVAGEWYDKISDLTFSPDGRRLLYSATMSGKGCVVVDGRPGPFYERVEDLHFTTDSNHFVYTAVTSNRKLRDLVDSIEDLVDHCLTIPVGDRKTEHFIVDGRKAGSYDSVRASTVTSDGKHLVCWAEKHGQFLVVVDGKTVARAPDPSYSLAEGNASVRYVSEDDKGYWLVNIAVVGR